LQADPKNAVGLYYLGSAYAGLELPTKAIESLARVEPGRQYFSESRLLATFLSKQIGDLGSAVDYAEELVDSDGESVRNLRLLAGLQAESGQDRRALKSVKSLIALEPNNAAHLFTMATIYDRLGDSEETIAALERSIKLDPKNAETLNYLAYTLAVENIRLTEARGLVERALKIDPDNGYYVDSLGWVLYRQGNLRESLKQMERANLLSPHDAVIMEHWGIVLRDLGRRDEAAKVFRDALLYSEKSEDDEVGKRLRKELETIGQR